MNKITNNKQIAKNSLYLYFRMGVLMIISFISLRFLLNGLGSIDYGIYSAVGGLVISFSFISHTLVSASQRFFSIDIGLNDHKSLKKTYDSIILAYIIIIVVILLLLETVGIWFISTQMTIPENKFNSAMFLFQFSICTFIIHIITNPHIALIVAHEDMRTYAIISLLEGVLKLLAALSILWIPQDRLLIYPIMLFTVSIIVFLCYFLFCYKRYNCINSKIKIDYNKIKSVFTYSSWTIFGTMAGTANNQGINLLLNIFFGPIINTAYSVGHQVSGFLSQLSNSFFSAVRPPMTKSYALGSYKQTYQLFMLSTKILVILLSLIIVPVYVLIDDLLYLWLGQVDANMISFSRLMLIYSFLLAISNPITTIIQAAGAVKMYHGIVDSFVLLSLPISYIIFKMGGQPQSAFYVIIVVFFVAHIIRLLILKKYLFYSVKLYFVKLFVPAIFVIIITCQISIVACFRIESIILKFIVVFVLSSTSTLLFSYLFILNRNDRESLISLLKRK